jgi:hypothetical protein
MLSTANDGELLIERADRITARRQHWLWPRRIPLGCITTIAGVPGEGKSLVIADIVSRVTQGAEFPEAENPLKEPAEVLVISGEDDPETALVPRLTVAGADLARIHIVKSVVLAGKGEREFQLDQDIEKLKRVLGENPKIRMVVLDPVTDSLGRIPMYKEQEVRALLRPLRSPDIAIVLVAHLNKKEGLAAIHRVGGAGAFIGLARASWLLATNLETKQRQMLPLKNNYAARATPGLAFELDEVPLQIDGKTELVPRVKWLGESLSDANDILDVSTVRADAKAAAIEFLKEFLGGGPKEANAVREAAKQRGISERTLNRAKADLRVHSSKDGTGAAWTWSLR